MKDNLKYSAEYELHPIGDYVLGAIYAVPAALFGIYALVEGEFVAGIVAFAFSIFFIWFFRALLAAPRKRAFAKVYEDRVEVGSSFLLKRFARIESSKIESADYSQSILGRDKYGTVLVRGSGTRAIRVSPIKNAQVFVEAVRAVASSATPKSNIAPTGDIASNLADLNKLHDAGVLSDSDFEKAKNKILE